MKLGWKVVILDDLLATGGTLKMKTLKELGPEVDRHIRSILDFPKKGINFRDIMPLFANPSLVQDLCSAIAHHIRTDVGKVDAVAALEARGFLFGPTVAMSLGVPFVPIRKKGKLPGDCVQASYMKEYGEDTVEVQKDAMKLGWKVVILDDLLATGGTLRQLSTLFRRQVPKLLKLSFS
ncbi:putative adenine phosphoribosyltransferase [Ancylostoma caninum]|uniref:Adenine phosphoribosyltransferase n=1 Tax=Ancylostoma caninum TaxID=29170 RepID=A0A368FKA4_ANCCA|nr:putative adenine phosphoribosyltransferase [Ancylostoma caninum]